ncbi:MAG: hypothetical protein WC503_00480 [Candidatus Shapirobacteria bacterium]
MKHGVELYIRAAKLADKATEILSRNQVKNSLVRVTYGFAYDYPLAVRTSDNEGFGENTETYDESIQRLTNQAILQAKYSLVVGGRSASGQLQKLKNDERSSASYGIYFNATTIPGFAIDKISGLTVVTVSEDIKPLEGAEISQKAILSANKKVRETLPAVEIVYSCLKKIDSELPNDRTGVVMLALPKSRNLQPTIICSQSAGRVENPSNYGVVEAKVKAVLSSGKISGPNQKYYVSRILGAVPINVGGVGERILAAGGLPDGQQDLDAIIASFKLLPTFLKVSYIESLTK